MAKQLAIKMRAACLADKTVVNYFQVVRAVIASAVSSEGEQLPLRAGGSHNETSSVADSGKFVNPQSGSGWHGLSCLPSFPHSPLEKKPCAVGFGKVLAGTRKQKNVTDKYSERLKTDVEWRKEVAEHRIRVQAADCRKFSWATWATKTEKIGVEESSLTD
jgi:hypothetical protein